MSQNEQQQFSDLQQQLNAANRNVEETRANLSCALGRTATEARLYRSLFWSMLTVMAVVTLLSVLHQ